MIVTLGITDDDACESLDCGQQVTLWNGPSMQSRHLAQRVFFTWAVQPPTGWRAGRGAALAGALTGRRVTRPAGGSGGAPDDLADASHTCSPGAGAQSAARWAAAGRLSR